jgi:hypothetical protein
MPHKSLGRPSVRNKYNTEFRKQVLNDKFLNNNWIGLKVAAHVGATGRLSEKTICMASNFGENDEFLHYEVHSLYGYSHAMATQRYAV